MYKVYDPSKLVTSELIDIENFKTDYLKWAILPEEPYLNDELDEKSREMEIRNLMDCGITDEDDEKVASACSISHLMKVTDRDIYLKECTLTKATRLAFKPSEITADALKLKTVSNLKKRIETVSSIQYSQTLKYQSHLCPSDLLEIPDTPPDLHPGHELCFRIRIYHPFKYNNGIRSCRNPAFHQDFIVLGSQTLDAFRDKIICPNDLGLKYDMSDNPENEVNIFSKDIFQSSFLYIEDTFYNDCRDVNNIDYSETIIKWANERSDRVGPFKTAVMENTQFKQLHVRLGYPQVYQHQGNCEHLFVFSDIEILQPSDCCHSSCYPLYKSLSQRRARHCIICGKFVAKWIVKNSDTVPFDPAFFCDVCFRSYNYVNHKKVGNFEAYPYFDRMNAV